jgi:glycerol-3-phosphate acyltransferase PlsY
MPEYLQNIGLAHVLVTLGAYLVGSIPFGLIFTRMAGTANIREIGSGNVGATNVLRTGRKGVAAATLLFDAGKGTAAVLAAAAWGHEFGLVAAVAVVIGHNFPVWLGFNGGKGVATTFGVLLALSWPAALLALAVWIAAAAVTRYSSIAALAGLAAAPLLCWWLSSEDVTVVLILLSLLGILRHHANIRRLIAGQESKIRLSKPSSAPDETRG